MLFLCSYPVAVTTHPLHLLLNSCLYAHAWQQSQQVPYIHFLLINIMPGGSHNTSPTLPACNIIIYMLTHAWRQTCHAPCTFRLVAITAHTLQYSTRGCCLYAHAWRQTCHTPCTFCLVAITARTLPYSTQLLSICSCLAADMPRTLHFPPSGNHSTHTAIFYLRLLSLCPCLAADMPHTLHFPPGGNHSTHTAIFYSVFVFMLMHGGRHATHPALFIKQVLPGDKN